MTWVWHDVHRMITSSDRDIPNIWKSATNPTNFWPPRWPMVVSFEIPLLPMSELVKFCTAWMWSLWYSFIIFWTRLNDMQKLCHSKGKMISFNSKILLKMFISEISFPILRKTIANFKNVIQKKYNLNLVYLLSWLTGFENPQLNWISNPIIDIHIFIERHDIWCITHECSEHCPDAKCLSIISFL